MIKPGLALLAPLAALCIFVCASCEQRDIRDFSAEEHFSAAQACKEADEDLALAIWHYEQALATGTLDEATTAIAKMELETSRDEYFRQSGNLSTAGAKRQDYETQVQLLKRRNNELESWISRLNSENLTLRQSLLKTQEDRN